MVKRLSAVIAATAALLAASPASAHVFGASGAGWTQGFLHPFGGIDHMLAMVAVGIWAAQIGRPALWLLPVAFPLAMAAGASLAMFGAGGVVIPGVETGIAVSVALLGLLIALGVRPRLGFAFGIVALFAVFHGYAHGTELPETASPLLYGLGFVVATAFLHCVGLVVGHAVRRPFGEGWLRAGGGAIAGVGVGLLVLL